MNKQPVFSSRLAAALTLIGLAVGLGNVWRFPYMMGKYGGSAFLLVYLGFTVLFAIPALIGETALGRASGKGIFGAFQGVFGQRLGGVFGGMILITLMVATSYYAVVIANVLFTGWHSVLYGFSAENIPKFEAQLGNGWFQFGIVLFAMAVSLFIIYKGLRKGIEPMSKIFVPFFLIAIIYLIINALNLDGAKEQMLFFLQADFSALKAEHIYAALGQTFFSVGLGGNFMIVFGSYLRREEKLLQLALFTTLGDVSAAILAGLFIIPTILVFGLDMTSGPTLIFSTLPRLFAEMPGGWFMGSLFLVALSMVALLSLIAALEVIVSSLPDLPIFKNVSKGKLILGAGLVECFLALPSALDSNLIGILDLIFGSGMMVLGSCLAIIGLTWGLGKTTYLNQVFDGKSGRFGQFLFFWTRWVVPAALLAVLIGYVYSSFF